MAIISSQWIGRFGNRMHQYAYGVTYARKNDVEFLVPSEWEGTKLFKRQYHSLLCEDVQSILRSRDLSREERNDVVKNYYPNTEIVYPDSGTFSYDSSEHPVCFDDICAYNDSIFSQMSKKDLLEIFEFSDEVKNTEAYKYWESKSGTYDIAHLRRDDIANVEYNKTHTQGYSVISKSSYVNAILQNGFNLSKVEWTSDDYLKKWHKDRPDAETFGWEYPEGSNYRPEKVFDWLEDFLRLYFARTIFRANSSFSWWAGFLSPTATVYSPVLDKQVIYGSNDVLEEIRVNFVKGNHPHWMYQGPDINIPE
jgi:hypothetical protein